MSPSVAGRKRPRDRSCSFHVLWWLVRREAIMRILYREYPAALAPDSRQRRRWSRAWREASRIAARLLVVAPGRLFYPG